MMEKGSARLGIVVAELDVAIGLTDGFGPIVKNAHVDGGRQLRLENRQKLLDAVGDLDRVGSGLALDGENDGSLAAAGVVEPRRRFIVFHAVDDVAQLVEVNRRRLAVGDDKGTVGGGAGKLAARHEGERTLWPDDRPRREIHVPIFQGGLDFVDSDLPGGQSVGIHLDVNRVFLRSEHLHLSDSADHGDALRDPRLGVIIQRVEGERRGSQGDVENGLVRRVYLGKSRRRRHPRGQKTRRLRDGGLHVHGGAIQVPA